MLYNKSTTIILDSNDFFISSEKAINTILTIWHFLKVSEKQIGIESKCNNEYKNHQLVIASFDFSVFWCIYCI